MTDTDRNPILLMPYCSTVFQGPDGRPDSRLSVMSDIAARAGVEVSLHTPNSELVLAGELHPKIPLRGTSELTTELAVGRGMPRDRIVRLDRPDELTNNTRQQLRAFANYAQGGAAIVGWSYHGPRIEIDTPRNRRDEFRFRSVESVITEFGLEALGVGPDQLMRVQELIARLERSERILRVASRIGLGFAVDAITELKGPRHIDIPDISDPHQQKDSHLFPRYRRLLASGL